MSGALKALSYVLLDGSFDFENKSFLFLNAEQEQDILSVPFASQMMQQSYYPAYHQFERGSHHVVAQISDGIKQYSFVAVLVPKNMKEARYLIAQAIRHLEPGGTIICAADNNAGGARLKKLLSEFGVEDLRQESKNKAKVVWGAVSNPNKVFLDKAEEEGAPQTILEGRFWSQPGVFGWDKIDAGSKILCDYLPTSLNGKGADFGCGYGFLSDHVLANCPAVKSLICADADFRAVSLCEKNLAAYPCEKKFMWCDLTIPFEKAQRLDFVVMNPPFHEGKKADTEIGQKFIRNAYQALGKNGELWMVANSNLPYENVIKQVFGESQKLYEGQGFKVFHARKQK